MKTPFGTPIFYDKVLGYIDKLTPTQMIEESNSWGYDPNDLLLIADFIYLELYKLEYAAELYKKAIKDLYFPDPSPGLPDIDSAGIYATCGIVLMKLLKFEESLKYFQEAYRFDSDDYLIIYGLAVCNYKLNKLSEAQIFINKILNADEALIKTFLSDKKIKLIKDLSEKLNDNDERHWTEIEKAESFHSEAINHFSTGSYEKAIAEYKSAISIYEKKLNEMLPESLELSMDIKYKLSLAYLDLSMLYGKTKSEPHQKVISLIIKALTYNRNLPDAIQNLLYYIGYVNAFLKARRKIENNLQHIAKLYNAAYDLLKTPYPLGTAGRNWEGAINLLKEVERIAPDLPYTHHLLGLAYEGCKMDELAIDEWMNVYVLDPNFDFETRVILS